MVIDITKTYFWSNVFRNLRIADLVSKYMASSSEAISTIFSKVGCRYIPTRVCSVFTTRIRRCFGSPTYVNICLGSIVSAVANLIDGVGFDLRSISLSI